ncbi:MAG: GNAT family N-acetyltransferase [Sinobacteraceae bacterium]|nr:GNAT family N-acetyltransferase [Nevskiaceae bacterium]
MGIEYKLNSPVTVGQFVDLLARSTLGERRPVEDLDCIEGMLANSNLVVSAWDSTKLVGIARSITDFHYACYLSDLAVCQSVQRQGIGRQLQVITQGQLGPRCKLILVAAPAANTYYGHIGYSNNPRCWILPRNSSIRS